MLPPPPVLRGLVPPAMGNSKDPDKNNPLKIKAMITIFFEMNWCHQLCKKKCMTFKCLFCICTLYCLTRAQFVVKYRSVGQGNVLHVSVILLTGEFFGQEAPPPPYPKGRTPLPPRADPLQIQTPFRSRPPKGSPLPRIRSTGGQYSSYWSENLFT